MTRLLVNVELEEQGQPVFQLTPAQLAKLGLSGSAVHVARWEVAAQEAAQPAQSPFRRYVGIAPPLEGGSVEYHRQQLGYEE
jgi:hypothetical protein